MFTEGQRVAIKDVAGVRGSIDYLRGYQLDYVESLSDSGFKLTNPNAARSCGCGTSFEPATA